MKPWYKSKVIWVNILVLLVTAFDVILERNMVPDGLATIVLAASCVSNVLLRFVTYAPIISKE